MVILGTSSDKEKEDARRILTSQFPGVSIKAEEELLGTEAKVVVSVGNFNKKNMMSMVSFTSLDKHVKYINIPPVCSTLVNSYIRGTFYS